MSRRLLFCLLSLFALTRAAQLSIDSLKVVVSAPDGTQLRSESLANGKRLATPLSLGPSDVLKLSFSIHENGVGVQPHQTFLRFVDEASGEEGLQPIRVSSSGKAKFELNMARPPTSLPPTTEKPVRVSLLLGSYHYDPLETLLFDLALPPSHPAPVHADEETFHVRPEIQHTFRPDPTSPPQIVSAIFTALVLTPWLLLLGLWSSIPHKLPHIFNPTILSFILLLAAFEALLYWYWVALKLGQVLAYGAVLGLVTAASGKYALANVARWRTRVQVSGNGNGPGGASK